MALAGWYQDLGLRASMGISKNRCALYTTEFLFFCTYVGTGKAEGLRKPICSHRCLKEECIQFPPIPAPSIELKNLSLAGWRVLLKNLAHDKAALKEWHKMSGSFPK